MRTEKRSVPSALVTLRKRGQAGCGVGWRDARADRDELVVDRLLGGPLTARATLTTRRPPGGRPSVFLPPAFAAVPSVAT